MTEPDDALMLSILKEIRADLKTQGALLVQTVDDMRKMEQRIEANMVAMERRLDARIVAIRDDFETVIERRIDALTDMRARSSGRLPLPFPAWQVRGGETGRRTVWPARLPARPSTGNRASSSTP
jgi:hypothetical protein